MRRYSWLVCSALVLCPLGASFAADNPEPYPVCSQKPSDAERKAAQGAFAAGQGSFNEGDYKTAITYWRDAYRRDCTAHALLLNLARAYESSGDKKAAVLALKTYLDRNPDPGQRPQIERRIENLEAHAATTASAAVVVPPTATTAPTTPATAATTAPTSTGPETPPPAPETTGGHTIYPWIVVGAGGVLTIVGGIIYLGGKSKVDDAEALCPNRSCPADLANKDAVMQKGNDGKSQVSTGQVLTGVGLVAVAGGVVWHFLEKPAKPKTTAFTPTVAPGFAGLSFGGQF